MRTKKGQKKWVLFLLTLGIIGFYSLPAIAAKTNEELGAEMMLMYRSARAVISDNQALINNPEMGDKGLSGAKVIEEMKKKYKATSGIDFIVGSGLENEAKQALLIAIGKAMKAGEMIPFQINEKGKGFKGFLPAVFAKLTAQEFTLQMKGTMGLKLTAPGSYVRNRVNRPDEWENNVIETMFKRSDWEKHKSFSESASIKGAAAYRSILPEYYAESCLKCHGEPKGELDITGGAKEGGKLGELGGAISFYLLK